MCINPGSRFCDCPSCTEDKISVCGFRNLEIYNNSKNPLAAWMNSDEWTEVPRVLDSRGNRLSRGQRVKGITTNEVSGEFMARG